MNKIKKQVKQFLRMLWERKYQFVIELMILCALFGTLNYFSSSNLAGASIAFNYSEASQGLSPNKTRLNIYELVSDEVLQQAIDRVGLQDSITASQLADCLYITPDRTGSVSGSTDFISTTYNLSINTKHLELENRKTLDLLRSICESYRTFFLQNYGDNQTLLTEKLEVTTDCEPFLRIQELQIRAEQIMRYLNARLNENKGYVDDENPDSSTNNFTTLAKQISNILDYDIANVNAFVIENGISRDADTLISILDYKNKLDDLDMRKYLAYYDADKNGISIYEKSMTSVVMIPTTDELSEFYMSRTKTAMDTMARSADDSLSSATERQSNIVDTSYIIQKMQGLSTREDYLAAAQQMINKLENGINEVAENAFVLDKAFVKYKTQNYLSFTYNSATFIQRFQLKKTGVEAVITLCAGVGLFHLYKLNKKKKKKRS